METSVTFQEISSNIIADKNLETAKNTLSFVKLAVEKMNHSKALCDLLLEKVDKYNKLLEKLNVEFIKSNELLDEKISKKTLFLGGRAIEENELINEEIRLIKVSYVLAGVVKTMINTPILLADGDVSNEFEETCENINSYLPKFELKLNEISELDYDSQYISKKGSKLKKILVAASVAALILVVGSVIYNSAL